MGLRKRAVRTAAALRRLVGALGEAVLWAYARAAPQGWTDREPTSILVLRNNDLGDMLIITPLFAALRRRFPGVRIAAAAGRWSLPVLTGNPHISEVLIVNAPWFNKFVPHQSTWHRLRYLVSSPQVFMLRHRRFDVGIDVLGSRWGAALLLRAGVPRRLGVCGYAGGHTGCQRTVAFDPCEHVGRSALRFAELLGATELPPTRPQIFLSPAERTAGDEAWRAIAARGVRRIVVAPGSGLATKSWPLASYAELAARLAAQPDVAVAIAGGPQDHASGERLAAAAGGRTTNLAGHLSLRESFALVSAADLVVCNSSVLMHAAAAFDRPTVVLLGESFSSARQHQAQWGYPRICVSLGKEPGELDGLATPEEALAVIGEIISRDAQEPPNLQGSRVEKAEAR
jgi:lipopolysaccharide heptosyltransferase II